ncbi:Glutathione-regulated potassium-efflux system protein KefC [compost metagenome]
MQRSFGGMPIFYGDPLRPEILRAVKVDKAEFFVVATNNPETNMETARLVRKMYPHVKVIARARNRQHVYHLLDMDAKPVRETFYSSLEMSRMILLGIGLSEEQAQARIRRFTQHDEEVLMAQYAVYDDEQAVVQTTREARADLENLFAGDQFDELGAGKKT